jgi:hypothetical protein
MIGLWALVATTAEAGCDQASLTEAISRAEVAFAAMDATAFDTAIADARDAFVCQTDALTPVVCADWHRVLALDAFLRDDGPDAVLAFHAALNTMPGYDLPTSIAPMGHPLRTQFEQAKLLAPGGTFDLPVPSEGWVAIDGQRGQTAPSGRPFVFQRFDDRGHVADTRYVEVGAPMPDYPAQKSQSQSTTPGPRGAGGERHTSPALIGTGIALGVVSGALYGAAFVTRSNYDEAVETGNEDGIKGNHAATNGLVIGSIGALGLGLTFVIVGL